ncbi:MAG: ribonuclease P protein component [Patescibacteria group bacterium]
MLSKKNRLNKAEIEQIFKKSAFFASSYITLRYLIKNEQNKPKIAFITPKTTAKRAVKRNLLRRRGYFLCKKYINMLPGGFLGTFIFNKKSLEVFGGNKKKTHNPIENMEKELKAILQKAKLI